MPAKQATSRRVDRSGSKDGQTTFADPMGPEPMFPTARLQRVSNPPCMTVPCLCGPTARHRQATRQMAAPWTCVRRTPLGPWVNGPCVSAMPTGKPAQRHSDVQRRRAVTTLHKPGMVSRVPCSPCRAAARRADRNTYQISLHHAQARTSTDTR